LNEEVLAHWGLLRQNKSIKVRNAATDFVDLGLNTGIVLAVLIILSSRMQEENLEVIKISGIKSIQ